MPYVLRFKKSSKWRLYRNNSKIKVFNNKLDAESASKKLAEELKCSFMVKTINALPRFRQSSIFGKKFEEI